MSDFIGNLTAQNEFSDVPQLGTEARALGGPGGVMNAQAQALLNRFKYVESGSGSKKVGFTQDGAGAFPISMEQKARHGSVTPEEFFDDGIEPLDYWDCIMRAFATGKTVDFDSKKTYRTTKPLLLDISTLAGQIFQSQTINLNGASFILDEPIGSSTSGDWLEVGAFPLVLGTRFIVNGQGARISTTNTNHVGDAIRLTNGYGNQVRDYDARGFNSAVNIYVSDVSFWNESTIIDRVRGTNNMNGVRTSIIGGNTSSSFDQTHISNCEFNLTVNGAIGFNLEGFHGRTTLSGCGAWPDEEGATGCASFYLNGNFSNSHMIGCWADAGATDLNTIKFGPQYTCLSENNSSMAGAMTVIGTGVTGDIANYMKLPPGWQYRLKVLDCASVYGCSLWRDELDGTGDFRNASPGAILQFSGQFNSARGTTNTLYKKTINLPSGVRRLQHAVISPYANGIDSQARSAGQCGVFSIQYASGSPVSVTFFMIPTNVNGTGGGESCAYLYDISLQMN